jgi:hypothetical protein
VTGRALAPGIYPSENTIKSHLHEAFDKVDARKSRRRGAARS